MEYISGEYYDNADELLGEDDIIETDVKISGWKKCLRIRSLTFGQMATITQKATNDKNQLEESKFVLNTILEGVVRPRFNSTNVEKLLEKNGELVKQLSDGIWNLGRISKGVWDEYMAARKEQEELDSKK